MQSKKINYCSDKTVEKEESGKRTKINKPGRKT